MNAQNHWDKIYTEKAPTAVREAELPASHYGVWHDRAVFHFLTQESDRAAYVRQVLCAVKHGGHEPFFKWAFEGCHVTRKIWLTIPTCMSYTSKAKRVGSQISASVCGMFSPNPRCI